MPRRHRLLALLVTIDIALAGCPTRSKPDGTGAPDVRPSDTARPEADAASIAASNTTGMTLARPHAEPNDTVSPVVRPAAVLGAVRRSARLHGPVPPLVPGLRDGDPYVAIEADAVSGVLGPGDIAEGREVNCFLGRTPLWPTRHDDARGTIVLVGRDPGGDLGALPLWCAVRLLAPTAPEVGRTAMDAAYREVVARKAPARWLRGADGLGKEPPRIVVAPWKPGGPMLDPIGRWLVDTKEPTP